MDLTFWNQEWPLIRDAPHPQLAVRSQSLWPFGLSLARPIVEDR